MMNGQQIINRLGRLADATSIKDVRQLTAAMFPGTHCPLMGAAMAVRGIKDAVILVVGTDECTYYTKHMTLHSEEFGGIEGRCLSVVLDSHDVTFGCSDKLEAAFEEMMEEYSPKAVYIVTTCVVEIIGDDVDSMAKLFSKQFHIPVMAVHTEHFKCENHLPGLERTITASFDMMEPCPCDNSVNLLGQRMGSFAATELYQVLKEAGIKTGLMLPSGCTIDEIKKGPAAKVNIVVNGIALPLARKMKEAFGIPYVEFDKYTDPERVKEAYLKLFQYLELPLRRSEGGQPQLPEGLEQRYQEARDCAARAASELKGVTYIYGNTPFSCFEFNRFMVSLGMIPQIIQTSAIEEEDRPYIEEILDKVNPYVTKSANIAPLQYVYDVLKPSLYLGHEYAVRLRKKGIAMVRTDGAGSKLGFEITSYAAEQLMRAANEAMSLKKEEVR